MNWLHGNKKTKPEEDFGKLNPREAVPSKH